MGEGRFDASYKHYPASYAAGKSQRTCHQQRQCSHRTLGAEILRERFCGVFTNFHPDLYRWLQDEGPSHPELADERAIFLALAALDI